MALRPRITSGFAFVDYGTCGCTRLALQAPVRSMDRREYSHPTQGDLDCRLDDTGAHRVNPRFVTRLTATILARG